MAKALNRDAEYEEQARALAALLPLERRKTDRLLLTERARSDMAAEHQDDFTSIVSHDLRNLLHGILGTARIISKQAQKSGDGEKTVAAAQRIEGYVARMNRLIGDLLDVASIDTGKLTMYPESYDVGALVAEAVEVFSEMAEEKGISLESVTGETPLMAYFDRARMLQVLATLIANAINFTNAGGHITLHSELAGDEVRICVRDNGSGIAPNMLELVFERFWQAQKDHKGVGLGLYIARCIVAAHGGRIWAESKVGDGSAFHVKFPVAAKAAA